MFDSVHLIKNVRNNLLYEKKCIFLSFKFEWLLDEVNVRRGKISWALLYKVHERHQKLNANLQKSPKLTEKLLHAGN